MTLSVNLPEVLFCFCVVVWCQVGCLCGFRLTNPVGLQMSELSVEPRLAKAILASAGELACSQEVVTIVAMLSVHSVWAGARGERKAQNEAKMRSE
jgi:HrpA-like RNA helicase